MKCDQAAVKQRARKIERAAAEIAQQAMRGDLDERPLPTQDSNFRDALPKQAIALRMGHQSGRMPAS